MPIDICSPLRRTAKSAEVIDGKGVVDAPLPQRVRKHMKRKALDDGLHLMKLEWGDGRS